MNCNRSPIINSKKFDPPNSSLHSFSKLLKEGSWVSIFDETERLLIEYPNSPYLMGMKADASLKLGKIEGAIEGYKALLKVDPFRSDIYFNLGIIAEQKGDLDKALFYFEQAINIKKDFGLCYHRIGQILHTKGKLESALQNFDKATSNDSKNAKAYASKGEIYKQKGQLFESIKNYRYALSISPEWADVHNNLGLVLLEKKDFEESIKHLKKTIILKPNYVEGYNNLGLALSKKGDISEALNVFKKVLLINPDFAEANNNIGNILKDLNDFESAEYFYRKAIQSKPNYSDAYYNLGSIFNFQEKFTEAIPLFEQAIKLNPNNSKAYNNLGTSLSSLNQFDKSIQYFRQAALLNPFSVEILNNLAGILINTKRYDDAIIESEKAIKIQPTCAGAIKNKALSLKLKGKLNESLKFFNQSLEYNPNLFEARFERLNINQEICNWINYSKLKNELHLLDIASSSIRPFPMLSIEDNPDRQLKRAEKYVLEKHSIKPIPFTYNNYIKPKKLRIGYFSADFKTHPVSNQIVKLLSLHDRSQFEIYAYSLKNFKDDMQKQIIKSVNHFKNVSHLSDKDITLLARKDKIDIAIDLMGHTKNSRTDIFALRAAPLQINLFGGTLGASFIDYIIADSIVIPDRLRRFYKEKIIFLPHTFFPTDNTRNISKQVMFRKEFGLSEDGFVFCCFNNNYKITPSEFDIWMRLLQKKENSVLWMRKPNHFAKNNLRKEAKNRGIDPCRLVFADKLSTEDHLARHKLADLFLDTFNFNAHSTACDALWAGLPVLTKKGEQFVARCAASFLSALGLSELIVKNENDYEELALELATNSHKLKSITKKLCRNRFTFPLYNSEEYVKNFEKGLKKAIDISRKFKETKDIWISG